MSEQPKFNTGDLSGDRVSLRSPSLGHLRTIKPAGSRQPDKYDALYWRKVNEGKIKPPKWSPPGEYKP